MILLEGLMFLVVFYLFMALSVYCYSVLKTWEFTSFWDFKIEDGYIGICIYPKWLLGWVESIIKKIRKVLHK